MCECGGELVECVCGDRCCDDCGCREVEDVCTSDNCCSACQGTGSSGWDGPCSDCYGTGHAHPTDQVSPVDER